MHTKSFHRCQYDLAAGTYDGHPHFFGSEVHSCWFCCTCHHDCRCPKPAKFTVGSAADIWVCAEHYDLYNKYKEK